MVETTDGLVLEWGARPENTARSLLVTIFGDTVIPASTSIWLAQLFELTEVFGFAQRLVRTSMFRLAAEGWFVNERVGRQSRYILTATALEESHHASTRIYHQPHPDWSERWCVVFLHSASISEVEHVGLRQHLGWHGFVELSPDVLASPTTTASRANELCGLVAPNAVVPVGEFEFTDLERVVTSGFFDSSLALDDTTAAYANFVDFHSKVEASTAKVSGPVAFGLRSMLIHDLRRIRLRAPDLPTELLPADWVGSRAHALAGRLYSRLSATAAPWLSDLLKVEYPAAFADRFGDT